MYEDVRCITPVNVISEWKKKIHIEELKIHILKIDTEGHDFIILNSLFKYIIEEKKQFMLPLLIMFESKIKPASFPKTKVILIKLGYVCSNLHQPGKPENLYGTYLFIYIYLIFNLYYILFYTGDIFCILRKPLSRIDLFDIKLDIFN
jgi:hypothetical protein